MSIGYVKVRLIDTAESYSTLPSTLEQAIMLKDKGLRILVELITVEPLAVLEPSDELAFTLIVVAIGVTSKKLTRLLI
jgi:hypothetical protein